MKVKIRIDTYRDMVSFCQLAETIGGDIVLTGKDGATECSVNAKSIIGVQYSMLWNEIWCISDKDIYTQIQKYVVID